MATFLEQVSHLVDHYVLFVILVISRFGFEAGIWVLIAPVPGHCLLVTLIEIYIRFDQILYISSKI